VAARLTGFAADPLSRVIVAEVGVGADNAPLVASASAAGAASAQPATDSFPW
jgi:hypothetical protein